MTKEEEKQEKLEGQEFQEEENNDYEGLYPEDYENEIREDGEDIIDSSLEIGGQIHQQAPIIKKFAQLPKDVKYSKFGQIDLANFTLKSKTYQLWIYLKKVQKISKDELTTIKEHKKDIYEIDSLEGLKEHLEEINKGHIWYNLIQNYSKEQLKKEFLLLKLQLDDARNEGVIEHIYGDKDNFYNSYDKYLEENNTSEDIDDFGLMSGMMTLTETKKAHQGWGTKMMNTTINVTKDEDIDEDTEEEPEKKESFINKLKR